MLHGEKNYCSNIKRAVESFTTIFSKMVWLKSVGKMDNSYTRLYAIVF